LSKDSHLTIRKMGCLASFRRKPESTFLNPLWTPAFAGVTALYESDGFRSFGVLYSIFDILRFYFSQCKKSVLDCDHHASAQSRNIHILC
jgi:hypothetical protein